MRWVNIELIRDFMPITHELYNFLANFNVFSDYSFLLIGDMVFILLELNKEKYKGPKCTIKLGFEFVERSKPFLEKYGVDILELSYDPETKMFVTRVLDERLTKDQLEVLRKRFNLADVDFNQEN